MGSTEHQCKGLVLIVQRNHINLVQINLDATQVIFPFVDLNYKLDYVKFNIFDDD